MLRLVSVVGAGHCGLARLTKESTCAETPMASGHHGAQRGSWGWPRSKHMDRTKSWGKEDEPTNGGNAGWEGSGVDQITAACRPLRRLCLARRASRVPASWPPRGPPSTSWLFCRAPQATSRSCSSCFSFPVSSDSLGAMAAGDCSPAGQMALGGPQDARGLDTTSFSGLSLYPGAWETDPWAGRAGV